MAGQPLIATITGIPNLATVNVRTGPFKEAQLVAAVAKGTTGLRVLEVQQDSTGAALNGKVYQWFRVQFPDGTAGWCRDDLISVVGDGGIFGYGVFTAPAVPFYVVRSTPVGTAGSMTVPAAPVVQAAPVVIQPAQPVVVQPAVVQAQPVVVQPAPTVTVTTPTNIPGQSTQVVVQPAAPQVVAAPTVVAAAPAAPTVTVTTINTSGPATAICMNKTGANVRPGPGANNNPVMIKFNYRDTAQIVEVKQGDNNDYFKWIKINYQGKQGWVREDFVRFSGGITSFGYVDDLYPCPVPDAWWVRDYDLTGEYSGGLKHDGWDHAGTIGMSIKAGPRGGTVIKTQLCQKCGPEGASSVDKGFTMGDSRVWNDPAWNYGYGHYLIARYDNNTLPASTQNFLNSKGWGGYHAFVMYAHLSQILVQTGQTLTPGQEIAKLGNSGNSTGAHLHLELRFGKDPNAQWPTIGQGKGLETPGRLFFR